MTAHDLASVAYRLFGLYLVLQVVAYIPAVIGAFGMLRPEPSVVTGRVDWVWLGSFWPMVVFGAVGLALMTGAGRLAARVAAPGGDRPAGSISREALETVGVSLVGLVTLAEVFPRIVSATVGAAVTLWHRRTPLGHLYADKLDVARFAELGVGLAIGLWLCLGARSVANLIRALRQAGWGPRGEVGEGSGPDRHA
jgi:hypothetical protein